MKNSAIMAEKGEKDGKETIVLDPRH